MGKTTKPTSSAKATKASVSRRTAKKKISAQALLDQCKKNGLDSTGSITEMKESLLQFLMQQESNGESPSPKQDERKPAAKSKTGEAIAKELVCPITLQLPFDPVTAKDGRVYERNAIQTHIDTSKPLKSPVTNERMGKHLLPNPQARNIIEAAIQNGDIPDDLAKVWKDKMQQKLDLEEKKQSALAGNGKDAVVVAKTYHFGTEIFQKDSSEAEKWWKKAAQLGEILGLLMYARAILVSGSPKLRASAISCLTEAATKGCGLACLYMGQLYADGQFVEFDCLRATQFIRKGLEIQAAIRQGLETPLGLEMTQELGRPFVLSDDANKYYEKLCNQLTRTKSQTADFISNAELAEIQRRLLALSASGNVDLLPRSVPVLFTGERDNTSPIERPQQGTGLSSLDLFFGVDQRQDSARAGQAPQRSGVEIANFFPRRRRLRTGQNDNNATAPGSDGTTRVTVSVREPAQPQQHSSNSNGADNDSDAAVGGNSSDEDDSSGRARSESRSSTAAQEPSRMAVHRFPRIRMARRTPPPPVDSDEDPFSDLL